MEMVAFVLVCVLAVAIIESRRSAMQRIVADREEEKEDRWLRRRR